MKRTTRLATACALVSLPARAWAEVMDKEPTSGDLWGTAAMIGLAGFVAWLWKRWAGVIVSVAGLTWVWSFHWELVDPWVGPAIRQEAGAEYVRQAYASMMLCTLLHAAGMAISLRRWRGTKAS